MGGVCTQGPAEQETPDHPSFQSLLKEQKAKETTPEKEAEKQNVSIAFGLSEKSGDTATSSADRRPSESYMSEKDRIALDEKTKQVEAAAAELNAAASFKNDTSVIDPNKLIEEISPAEMKKQTLESRESLPTE